MQFTRSGPVGHRSAVAALALATGSVGLGALAPAAPAAVPGPNGRIVFARYTETSQDIWVMNADGSGATRLTTDPRADGTPEFSPDGTRIVFARAGKGYDSELWVMNTDGSKPRRIAGSGARSPSFSPDGRSIAFTSARRGDSFARGEVFVMDSNGMRVRQITSTPAAANFSPSYAPDGSRLVVTRQDRTGDALYVMDVDGSNATRLSAVPAGDATTADSSPSWGPLPVCDPSVPAPAGYTLLTGTPAADALVGSDGPDLIRGLAGDDVIEGRGGDDILCGGRGGDSLYAGDGADLLLGEGGGDILRGNAGNDRLLGGAQQDRIWGGPGADVLFGGAAADRLVGDAGKDVLNGGAGADTVKP